MAGVAVEVSQRASELRKQLAGQREELGGRIDQLERERLEQLEQLLRLRGRAPVAGVVLSRGERPPLVGAPLPVALRRRCSALSASPGWSSVSPCRGGRRSAFVEAGVIDPLESRSY